MDKNKFLVFAVVLLLFINIATLGYFFWWNRQSMRAPLLPGRPPFAEMMQKRLHLTDDQTNQISEIHERHMSTMDSLGKEYQHSLEQYFHLLQQDDFSQQVKDSLQNVLATITAQRASEAFNHFYKINQLLTKEQAAAYRQQLPEILDPILHPEKNLPPPGKD